MAGGYALLMPVFLMSHSIFSRQFRLLLMHPKNAGKALTLSSPLADTCAPQRCLAMVLRMCNSALSKHSVKALDKCYLSASQWSEDVYTHGHPVVPTVPVLLGVEKVWKLKGQGLST